jgi:hypothetical protein
MRPSLVSTNDRPPSDSSAVRPGTSGTLRRAAAWAVAFAAFGVSAEAAAQDQLWLRDRRYTEGAGIRVGNFELHPGVAAEVGYDSNYLRRSDQAGPAGSIRIRITPMLSLSTLGPQRMEGASAAPPPDVELRATAALTYNEFIGVNGDDASVIAALGQQRNISGNLDLNLSIRPRREWSGSLFAGIGRSVQPSEQGAFDQFRGAFDRLLARAGGELVWAPGSGLLDWRIGYRFNGTLFEQELFNSGPNAVQGFTNLEHTIQTRGRWRFLPRTAMLFDLRQSFIGYTNYPGGIDAGYKTSSHPLRAQIGVNGLITPSFGVLAMGGWGASFYEPRGATSDFDSFIGQAEVKWFFTPAKSTDVDAASLASSSLSVGFIRDFSDSLIGSYVERNRAYANLSYFFGGRVLVVLDGGVGPAVYPALPTYRGVGQGATVSGGWTDIRWDASLFGEYRLGTTWASTRCFATAATRARPSSARPKATTRSSGRRSRSTSARAS